MQAEAVHPVPLYDAHNHLQDERLAPQREAILAALLRENIRRMVVNGSSEENWHDAFLRSFPPSGIIRGTSNNARRIGTGC